MTKGEKEIAKKLGAYLESAPPKEEWEERFDKEFDNVANLDKYDGVHYAFVAGSEKGFYIQFCGKEIKDFVRQELQTAKNEAREELLEIVEDLIVKEILICHSENTPTSRLTSLAMNIKKLK